MKSLEKFMRPINSLIKSIISDLTIQIPPEKQMNFVIRRIFTVHERLSEALSRKFMGNSSGHKNARRRRVITS